MLKNLLHLTLLSYLWKRYRSLIVSVLLLILYFWLVDRLHQDYVSYSELNDDHQYLALSFIIKWMAFVIGVVVFLLTNTLLPLRQSSTTDNKNKTVKHSDNPSITADPFESIRHKDKLRSRADFVIEKQQHQLSDKRDNNQP